MVGVFCVNWIVDCREPVVGCSCNRENLGGMEGNSFSLSGVCDDRGQLPREGAG